MTDDASPDIAFADALATSPDPIHAGRTAAITAAQRLDAPCDLAFVFVTPAHAQRVGMIADAVRADLSPKHLLILTAAAVMGGSTEAGPGPAVSVLAASLPEVDVHPFWLDAVSVTHAKQSDTPALSELIGASERTAATFLFADPFSVPLVNLVPALSRARATYADTHGRASPVGTVVGGLASASETPGSNTLFLNGEARNHGAMGVTLSGPLQVDTVVSQGCRPVGRPMVITKARGNLILELAGQRAVDAVRDSMRELSEEDRKLLSQGLLIGRVTNEHKSHFGRADFLIRNVMGADERSGAVAIADLVSAGQTVQLQLHDQRTAREDLELLLDAQGLYERPAGALLISCTGRREPFFDENAHDARALRHAFERPLDGATRAKSGEHIDAGDHALPLAGFFAAGEIGPIGDDIYHHGHTAVAALFRRPEEVNL